MTDDCNIKPQRIQGIYRQANLECNPIIFEEAKLEVRNWGRLKTPGIPGKHDLHLSTITKRKYANVT